jgi:hypothetical protein
MTTDLYLEMMPEGEGLDTSQRFFETDGDVRLEGSLLHAMESPRVIVYATRVGPLLDVADLVLRAQKKGVTVIDLGEGSLLGGFNARSMAEARELVCDDQLAALSVSKVLGLRFGLDTGS